ncbi:hypothetical protein [Phytomonospora endophytica]|uniref:LppX_LprAFG lipoprotein n=1 Tax=Phytomonospora endophytica TaxID=714109 RepID=A0A841FMK6_9ACTN|nr:hypothetical protein [Phytomonospora endophytica]MBB6037245.1 hypothetical protein [Phytomonospora endophytica]GIG71255.1 hypothetical protein Pen01_75500 [Phytomonospora endophytica]
MRLRPHAAAVAALVLFGATATACSPKEADQDVAPPPSQSGSPSSDTPPAPVGDPREVVETAMAASMKASSYTMTVTTSKVEVTISIDYGSKTMSMLVDGTVDGDTVKGEVRVVDGKGYLNFTDPTGGVDTGGQWLAMAPEDVAEDDPFTVIKTIFDAGDLLGPDAQVTAESPGVYKITPAGKTFDLPEFFTELTDPGASEFQATELRLGVGADGLVSTMELTDAKGAKTLVSMSNYGIPVKVDKPADSEIMGG